MTDKYQKEREQFLTTAGKSFDAFVEKNQQPPVATGLINVPDSGDPQTSWITHDSELKSDAQNLAKQASDQFASDVVNNRIEMYDSYGQATAQSGSQTGSDRSDNR